MGKRNWSVGVGLMAMATASIAPAQGQQGQPARPSADAADIVITARRVEERLQDVPIAVSALSALDLQRQQLDDLGDIAEKTVGFSFESFSGAVVQPAIRGQTNLRVDSPVQNVAFYLDGIYLQRGYIVDQSLLELERIEIIKGPQSALYGRNAFAGAVNTITRRPDLTDYSVKFSGTIGNHDRYDWRGAINLPIVTDRLALFFNYGHSEFDGTWTNNHPLANAGGTTRGRLNGWEKDVYQGRVLWRPADWLTLDAEYIRTDRLIESPAAYSLSTLTALAQVNSLNCSPRNNLAPTGAEIPNTAQNRLFCGELRPEVTLQPGEQRLPGLLVDPRSFGLRGPTEVIGGKIEIAPDGSPITATYQFGRTKANIEARGSPLRNPLSPIIIFGTNFGTIFDSSGTDSSFRGDSHEIRFTYDNDGPIRALIGFNYSNTRDINSNATESAPVNSLVEPNPAQLFPIGPGLPFPSNFFQRSTFIERREDIFSGFFFLGIELSERFEMTLEGRYTGEDLHLTDFLTREPGSNPSVQAFNPFRSRRATSYFTPRATATYKFTPDNIVYASVARGVKSGGLNGNTPFIGQRAYDDETNWTYEIGSKNQFFDRAVTLNVAAYHTNWSNLQTGLVRLLANGNPPSFFAIVPSTVGNIEGVNVWGAEVEGTWRLAPPLTLDFGVSYNRSRYKSDAVSQRLGASGNCDGIVCQTVSVAGLTYPVLPVGGNSLERVPLVDARVGLNFDTTLGNGWGFFARADTTYQTKIYSDESNLNWAPDRILVNAATGLSIGPVDLRLWVKNLLDEKYVTNAFVLIGTSGARSAAVNPTLGDRRTFGLTGTVAFGPGARP